MRLHPRVRLKFDRVGSTWMLLYPEGGVVLNRTAFEIAQLCERSITRSALLDTLAARYPSSARSKLEKDANTLLDWLIGRGLLQHEGFAPEQGSG